MSKIRILNEQNQAIVGILEKKPEFDVGYKKPRLALILHGLLGFKDHLFNKPLAEKLPISSFRFDFRGNGESEGEAGYANTMQDTHDIATVIKYFEKEGYEVYAIVAHSRGSISASKYAAECEKPLPLLVNISSRYETGDHGFPPEVIKELEEKGSYSWSAKHGDRLVTVTANPETMKVLYSWNNDHLSKIPLSTNVLLIHGTKDWLMPPFHVGLLANAIPNRRVVLIQNANHNFLGFEDKLISVVLDFFKKHEESRYEQAASMGQTSGIVIPRWVDIDGVRNFRDIGGWPLKDNSGYIRERTVFRSGNLSKLTPDGLERLDQLNVKAIFDFRLDYEIGRDGSLQNIPNVTRFGYNLFEEAVKSPKDMIKNLMVYLDGPEGFAKGYMVILDSGKRLIGEVLRYMVNELSVKDRSSILVHCTAGKDRTGVFIAVLLGLCGVDDEVIAREYDMSKHGYFEFEKDLDLRAKQVGVTSEQMRAALTTSLDGMRLTIKQLKEKYGSFEGYVKNACGLTSDEINKIRKLMVVPFSFEQRQLYRSKI